MKKYIENLEEKVSSVLNESLVSDAAELVGIEEEDAEERIKGLSFANYIELGNAIDLEDAETAREILSTVAPIEEGNLAKAAAIGTMALGLGSAAIDQGAHADDILDQPTPTVRELADMHDVPVADIASQLAMGIKAEKEHTSDPKVAKEIALDHLRELPDYYAKLEKMEETASAGASGAGGVASVGGDIGTWDGKAHKKLKKGLKKAGKGIYEDSSDTLYHVTHTKYIPQITKNGLRPMGAPSNWVQQGSGDRYGMGEIYVFTNYEDAKKWAGRMDWDFNQTIGSGEISIITLRYPEGQDFEKDEADPMSQAGAKGDWLKTYEPIEPENIVDVQIFKSMNEAGVKQKYDTPQKFKVTFNNGKSRTVKAKSRYEAKFAAARIMKGDPLISGVKKIEHLEEADNPYATPPSQGSSVDALAQQTDQAEATPTAQDNQKPDQLGRKEVDDLTVGDNIEVIDIDGDPTPVTVKTPRGPGDTLVVQTDKGEEHIVKKQAVSGTPTIQEMYEEAIEKFATAEVEEEVGYESALTDRVHEAYNANKTEHSGAKKGKGGYHGRKQDAKRDSNKKRRANDKKALDEVAPPGMEDWIKSRKPEFKKRYGDRWEEVLYATAWKRHNNESVEGLEEGLNEGATKDMLWDAAEELDRDAFVGIYGEGWGEFWDTVHDVPVYGDYKELDEVAPPGQEEWIKKRKPEFKDRYGDRWEEVLYATAWKRHNNESVEEDKDEFVKKLQQGDRYFVRREYHIGKTPYRDFEAQVLDVSDTEDTWSGFKHKVRFTDNNGEEVVAWYPEPGKGGLSGRFYDEQLVKAGEKGKYVAGDSRSNWPAVGVEEAFDPATHVNVEYRDPESRFIIVHVPPAGYWAVGQGSYYNDIDRTSFDSFDDALEHAELCLSSIDESFDLSQILRLAGVVTESKYGVYRKSKQQLDAPSGNTSSESAKVKRGGKHVTFKNKKEADEWVKNNSKGEELFVRKVSKPVNETASAGATGAGAIATAPAAMGGMVKRNPSIYGKPEPKKRKKESSDDGIGRAKKK